MVFCVSPLTHKADELKRKFITNITAEAKAGIAYIRIVDIISEYSEASSWSIRNQVDEFLRQGIRECELYINSRGGDAFEAAEMTNDLSRFDKVTIRIGFVAASAATYPITKFHTIANVNSQIMIHRPSMGTYGNVAKVESDLVLLKNITQDYKTKYAAKTGKSEDEIETMWLQGDVWMTAQEAKDAGFIDEIETQDEVVTEQDIALLEACAAPVVPAKTVQPKTNDTKMNREALITALGLPADATDDQIEAAVKRNKERADRLSQVEASAENTAQTRAEALANEALAAKKITAAQLPQYTALAKADYDNTKAILDGMKSIPQLSAQLEGTQPSVDAVDRKGWTLDDYIEKAPEVYAKMKTEDPAAAAALEKAYFSAKK